MIKTILQKIADGIGWLFVNPKIFTTIKNIIIILGIIFLMIMVKHCFQNKDNIIIKESKNTIKDIDKWLSKNPPMEEKKK